MKVKVCLLFLTLAGAAFCADQPKPAPNFELKDASGKTVKLKNYRGKVVLLDFWATWCTGCKQEMPWFVEYQKKYGSKGFQVVGVAMDDDGWKTLTPFLKQHAEFSYKMLLGDQATAQRYGSAEGMPDSFLIDRKGRLVATYKGVVDRDSLDASIQALLVK